MVSLEIEKIITKRSYRPLKSFSFEFYVENNKFNKVQQKINLFFLNLSVKLEQNFPGKKHINLWVTKPRFST